MPPEESPSEQEKEKTNGLEADFVSTPCTEEQYIFKMIGQELREKPDTTDIELPNLFKKYGTYEQYQKAAKKTEISKAGFLKRSCAMMKPKSPNYGRPTKPNSQTKSKA